MDAAALVKAAGSDPSDEGDIIFHLCEKIREQSQLLADLQKRISQYEADPGTQKDPQLAQKCKDLERKLADLTRPIPLSDTLSFPPPSVSLSLSQLMELYSLLYVRMNEVIKEKEELQANLHEEILFSEEQSVILETMREEMASAPKTHHFHSESAQTIDENTDLMEQIRVKTEALNEAYAEITKLEEEKNALLEYVEKQAEREEQNAAEIANLRAELTKMSEEDEFPQSPKVLKNGENEEKQAKEDLAALRSAYEKTILEMEELEEQGQNCQLELTKTRNLVSFKEAEIEKTAGEVETLRRKYEETVKELEELRDFRKSEEEANLSVLQEEHVLKLEEDNKSLRRLLSTLQSEMETMQSERGGRNSVKDVEVETERDNEAVEMARVCQREVETLRGRLGDLVERLNGKGNS